jgi:hypothetical protein
MRSLMRIWIAGCAVALMALPLLLVDPGGAPAAQPHGITAPAQVSASNWSVMPDAVTTATAASYHAHVSCVTSVFCMKVGNPVTPPGPGGNSAFAQEWNGTTWSPPLTLPTIPSATASQLSGVSCVTTSYCVAVGFVRFASAEGPLIEQWNGSAWTIVSDATTSPPTLLNGVSCLSVSFCMASGYVTSGVPIADQWNGSTWTSTTLTTPSAITDGNGPFSVSCASPTECMMVGYGDAPSTQLPLVWSWNGSMWASALLPLGTYSSGVMFSVSCAGASFCTAVGFAAATSGPPRNLVEIWNGSSWSLTPAVPQPSSTSPNVSFDVSCFSATSCTAVGFTVSSSVQVSQVLTWNGQSWSVAASPNPSGATATVLTGVACLTNWTCVAVGNATTGSTNLPFDIWAPIARSGYRFVASDGGIFNYGAGAPFLGSMGGQPLNKPIIGMATMPAGDGYYLVASDGGIFNFGSAQFYGSTGSIHLNKPIVGMAVTPDGGGYWLVASDGGIFNYGDAPFYGSMGGQPLNKPIVGMAATPNGNGYYLVASDGGIFTFPTMGGPPFLGSTGAITLNKPIVGMAVTPAGQYYLVASDGGIFSFPSNPSGPPFFGSTGAIKLNQPVIGMTLTAAGAGYYLGAADGGIFSFPVGPSGPPFFGSRGGQPLNMPIVGISG